jgi:hypothetical protein
MQDALGLMMVATALLIAMSLHVTRQVVFGIAAVKRVAVLALDNMIHLALEIYALAHMQVANV